jgi:predicted RNA methylase
MSDITWTNTRVRLGDLKPWSDNPRMSTKAQAKRLLASFDKFGQVQTVAVDPDCNVLDGHQRLSALLTLHGDGYELDARQSSRPLTDAERQELVISLHAGAVGSWDWDKVSSWSAADLQGWGMDGSLLNSWGQDYSNLKGLIESEQAHKDTEKAWRAEDEPEFYANPDGDGIELQAGYRLSSIWYGMTSHNDVRKFMLELPNKPNVSDGATVKLKYSRTNAEETERIVKTYMRPLDIFYEMCCGWMTFSSTAKYFGYSGMGGDIWDVSLEFCERQIEAMPGDGVVTVGRADCRDTQHPPEMFDFVHSNPPFFSLEPYGDGDDDLASVGSYERWLDAMGQMGAEAERILKPGGLANFVINDYRENGEIVPMHADFINAIKRDSGMALHDLVVAEVISQALRFRKHDYERRRTVKCHEYVITFKKPGVIRHE